MNEVTSAILRLCDSHLEPKARWRAMKSVKWVLQSPTGQYAGLDGFRCALFAGIDRAQIFDGRDNEKQKAAFYSASLRVQLQPVLISCAS